MSTIKKIFNRFGLVRKMTLLMTLLLCIPILVVSIIYFQTFNRSVTAKTEASLRGTQSIVIDNIEETIGEVENYLNELLYRIEFSYYLNDKYDLSENEQKFYISKFQSEQINGRYLYKQKFTDIKAYSSNKQIDRRTYTWQYWMEELEEKSYYREVAETSEDIVFGSIRRRDSDITSLAGEQMLETSKNNLILPVYKKIYDLNTKELIGVIEIDISVLQLINNTDLVDVNNDILLLDSEGSPVFSTITLSKEELHNIQSTVTRETESAQLTLKGEIFQLLFAENEKTKLHCITMVSKQEDVEYIFRGVMKIVAVTLLCVLLMGVITYLIINNMLKRLLVLDKMIHKVSAGDFNVQMKDEAYGDELTRISNSFNTMTERLNMLMIEAVEKEKMRKEAELRALQAQINPHFLYNTLENMRMQCEIDEYYTVSSGLAALSDLFRYSISWDQDQVPFSCEWKNLLNYLEIMQMRFEEDIICDIMCDSEVESIMVPKLILQPLVENCFNHGFRDVLPPWKLTVRAVKEEDNLRINIEDNGSGISKERMDRILECIHNNQMIDNEKKRHSIGLVNVNYRIAMVCKEGSKLEITSKEKQGTRIAITIVEVTE